MRWEYKVEKDPCDDDFYTERGRFGWELVAVRQSHSHVAYLYWTRPLPEPLVGGVYHDAQP